MAGYEEKKEREMRDKVEVILNAVHSFFTGKASLMIGAMPVRFALDKDRSDAGR